MSKKMKENGVKLFAAVMVLAVAITGFVLIADGSDAAGEGDTIIDDDIVTHYTTLYVGGKNASDDTGIPESEENPYATIAGALNKNSDKNIIINLLSNVNGDGWSNPSGRNLTINFNGYTFEMDGQLVGSKNTKSQVFQLLKDSNVTFNNGTITTGVDGAGIIIQNYSNLTLNNMILDGTNLNNSHYSYTLSCNNGEVKILGSTTIKASTLSPINYAFDACWNSENYPAGAAVTLDTTGTIYGNIEIGDWKEGMDAKTILDIKSGTINGDIYFTTNSGSGVVIDDSVDVDVIIPEGKEVTGSVAFGDNSIAFTGLTAGENGITLSRGSVVISGTINADDDVEITANGTVKLNGVEITGTAGGLTVTATGDADSIIIGDLQISEGASLSINSDAAVEVTGTLKNEGSMDYDGEFTFTGSGELQNEGTYVNGTTVYVATWTDYNNYATQPGFMVILNADIVCESNVTVGANTFIYLNSHELDLNGNALTAIADGSGVVIADGYREDVLTGAGTLVITSSAAAGNSYDLKVNVKDLRTTDESKIVFENVTPEKIAEVIQSGGKVPKFAVGMTLDFGNSSYVIYQFKNNTSNIQYGISVEDLTYKNKSFTDEEIFNGVSVKSFDSDWKYTGAYATEKVVDIKNAGPYPKALKLGLNFENNSTEVGQPVITYADLYVNKATPGTLVSIEGWSYGSVPSVPVIEYNSPVDSSITRYPGEVIIEYYMVGENDQLTLVDDIAAATPGTYRMIVTFPELQNYKEVQDQCNFTITEAEIELDFESNDENYEIETDGNNVIVSGEIVYIPLAGNDGGYYLLKVTVNNNQNVSVSLDIGATQLISIPANDSVDFELRFNSLNDAPTVTASADNYANKRYTFNFDELYRVATAGFDESADVVTQDILNEGKTVSDVIGNTMWIVFDQKTTTAGEPLIGKLYYNNSVVAVYEESAGFVTTDNRERVWYFSFDDQASSVDLKPGMYTLKIFNGSDDEVASAYAYVQGFVGSGFAVDSDDVGELIGATGKEIPGDIDDFTMFFVWYQKGHENSTVTFSLFKDGVNEPVFQKTSSDVGYTVLKEDGLRIVYLSFSNELANNVNDALGNWNITVSDENGTYVTGTLTITSESTSAVVLSPLVTEILGATVSSIQGDVSFALTQDVTKYIANGSLIYTTSFPGFWGDESEKAGYYLIFNINDSDFDWNGVSLTFGTDNIVRSVDGTCVAYLGQNLGEAEDITFTIDNDGARPFFTATTYTINVGELEAFEYKIVLTDEENDTLVYYLEAGKELILPAPAVPDVRSFWTDENGKQRAVGSVVIITPDLDQDGDEIIEFIASYSGIPQHSLEYWIDSAIEYVYEENPYDYTGIFAFDNDSIIVAYDIDEDFDVVAVMNDMARYLGAVNRNSGGEVSSIFFNGELYKWNAAVGLKGSNWQLFKDGEFQYVVEGEEQKAVTLVSQVVNFVGDSFADFRQVTLAFEVGNDYGQKATFNYSIIPMISSITIDFDTLEDIEGFDVDSIDGLRVGQIITLPTPSVDDLIFIGWYDVDGNYVGVGQYTVTGSITLYAYFDKEDVYYNVDFTSNIENAVVPEGFKVLAGTAITLTVPGQVEGYVFDAWYVDGEPVALGTYIVNDDVEFVATYVEDEDVEYTVTFVGANADGSDKVVTGTEGTIIGAAIYRGEIPEGYSSFIGWTLDGLNYVAFPVGSTIVIDENLTLYPMFKEELPIFDDRLVRQQGDYDVAWTLNDDKTKILVYIVASLETSDIEKYRNALSESKINVLAMSGSSTIEMYLDDCLGYLDDGRLIVAQYTLDVPTSAMKVTAFGWYADHWFQIGDRITLKGFVPSSITVDPAEIYLEVGGEDEITATVGPETAIDRTVTWTSSDDEVATVVDGVVAAVGIGSATITATTANGLTAQCVVYVKDLDHIVVDAPDNLKYKLEQAIDFTGMTVTAYYTDGSSKVLDAEEYEVDRIVADIEGRAVPVTVSYNEKEDSFDITVGTLVSIKITKPYKTVYTVGETLDIDGMVVYAEYSNGIDSEEVPIESLTIEPTEFTEPADEVFVFVSYGETGLEVTGKFPVKVNPVEETTE